MTKSSKLASEILSAMGIVCLRVTVLAGHAGRSKVAVGGVDDRRAAGDKIIWFRNQRDAEKVQRTFLSRCFASRRTETGVTITQSPSEVVDTVCAISMSLGITPIKDCDVATMFDNAHAMAEAAFKMGRGGTLKAMRAALARIDAGDLRSVLSL